MKKARIMLAAVAIFGVVGTSLAFKAKDYGSTIFTGTTSTFCETPVPNRTITTVGSQQLWVSTKATTVCTFEFTTVKQ